jgi:hypothetical protein
MRIGRGFRDYPREPVHDIATHGALLPLLQTPSAGLFGCFELATGDRELLHLLVLGRSNTSKRESGDATTAPPSSVRKPIRAPRKVACPAEVSCSHCQKPESASCSHCQRPENASCSHCQKPENASCSRRHKSESMGPHPVARSQRPKPPALGSSPGAFGLHAILLRTWYGLRTYDGRPRGGTVARHGDAGMGLDHASLRLQPGSLRGASAGDNRGNRPCWRCRTLHV